MTQRRSHHSGKHSIIGTLLSELTDILRQAPTAADLRQQAAERIMYEIPLERYRDLLLDEDRMTTSWVVWLCTAPVDEIIGWIEREKREVQVV